MNLVCYYYYGGGNLDFNFPYESGIPCSNCDGDRTTLCDNTYAPALCAGGVDSFFYVDGTTSVDTCDNGLGLGLPNCVIDTTTTTEPTTSSPTTAAPTTSVPTTSTPTTSVPTTSTPTTSEPTTSNPTTSAPTTSEPTTDDPTTNPTTNEPTTFAPTTDNPTPMPTTAEPTTSTPTTSSPTTSAPTTAVPTTSNPTTSTPTTSVPTTSSPTTSTPTTSNPTTATPTTADPTTSEPTTSEPTTAEPTIPATTLDISTTEEGEQCPLLDLKILLFYAFNYDYVQRKCDICLYEEERGNRGHRKRGKSRKKRGCERIEDFLNGIVDDYSKCMLNVCDYHCTVDKLQLSANAGDEDHCGCNIFECHPYAGNGNMSRSYQAFMVVFYAMILSLFAYN